jgi:peptidoglycan/LPS O-acetylase OafA/YrhL
MSVHAPKSELPLAVKAKVKLGSLEVGRGIAALAVVMHHAGQNCNC